MAHAANNRGLVTVIGLSDFLSQYGSLRQVIGGAPSSRDVHDVVLADIDIIHGDGILHLGLGDGIIEVALIFRRLDHETQRLGVDGNFPALYTRHIYFHTAVAEGVVGMG